MLSTPQAILSASGQALLQPLGFGKHQGKRIHEVDARYWEWMAKTINVPVAELKAKVAEAASWKPPVGRPVIEREEQLTPGNYRHQKDFCLRFGRSSFGGLFFDIGTGKTRTMLEMLRLRWMPQDKALVLCPKSVFGSRRTLSMQGLGWLGQIESFTPHFTSVVLSGPQAKKLTLLGLRRNIYITNYETLLNDEILQALIEAGFTWLILDESHKIKNHGAATTKRVIALSANIELRWLMTGTPITNSEKDIWPQAMVLDRGYTFGTSFSKFYKSYFTKGDFGWYQGDFLLQHQEAFKAAIGSFSMRVQKRECLDLPHIMPPVIREIELTGETLKNYKEMAANAVLILRDETITAQYKIVEMTRLHQICGGGIREHRFNQDKIEALLELLEELPRPVVIAAIYKDEIRSIVKAVRDSGRECSFITGDVTDKDRQERIQAFSDGKLATIVLQMQAAGTGIDGLQRASSDLIFYSSNHQWEAVEQTKGRIDRAGQTEQLQFYHLLAALPNGKHTIDHAIYESHQAKDLRISDLIDNIKKTLEEQGA